MSFRNFYGQALGLKDEPDSSSQGKGNLTQQREHKRLEHSAPTQINHVPWPSQPWPSMMPMINNPQYPTVVNNFSSPIPSFSPYSQASKQHSITSSSRQPNIPGDPPTKAVPNLPLPKNKSLLPQKATFDKLGFVHFYGNSSGSKIFDLIGTRVIRNEASRSPTAQLTDGDKLQIRDDLFQFNRNQLVILQSMLPPAKGPNANKKPRIVCYMKCANQPKCKKRYVVKRHNNHFGYYESRCSHDHEETSDKNLPPEIQKMIQRRYSESDAPSQIVADLIVMRKFNPVELQHVMGNRMEEFNTEAGRGKISTQIRNKIEYLRKKAKKASVESSSPTVADVEDRIRQESVDIKELLECFNSKPGIPTLEEVYERLPFKGKLDCYFIKTNIGENDSGKYDNAIWIKKSETSLTSPNESDMNVNRQTLIENLCSSYEVKNTRLYDVDSSFSKMAPAQDPQRVVELSEGADEVSSELNTASLHAIDNSDDANANTNINIITNANANTNAINIVREEDEGQRAPTKRNYSTANAARALNNQGQVSHRGQVSTSNHGSNIVQGRQTTTRTDDDDTKHSSTAALHDSISADDVAAAATATDHDTSSSANEVST